jgi:hypothetical protein
MMTDTGRNNDPTLISELTKHFDEDAIVALTAWVVFQNLSAKFNAALGAEENGLCKLPDAFRFRKTARIKTPTARKVQTDMQVVPVNSRRKSVE